MNTNEYIFSLDPSAVESSRVLLQFARLAEPKLRAKKEEKYSKRRCPVVVNIIAFQRLLFMLQ